ncbi:hypothetical protein [Haloechinothrix sp. LS1_15]|uniref:hypothetical protein n=1 Tax=Haloechinothrix sp. LS1_15 TaxID=2652248 RepID=UPI0029442DEE|nr:hypothetical protein [Haloechinothrix sp. LS1_15]MDV6013397.1 hypothetical protein [Haloechinothrix sp. LS1_15]
MTLARVWPLGGLTVVVLLLAGTGIVPVWSGLPHLVALPPVDLYTDLRLLLTGATSVPAFLALLLLVAVVRIVVLALLLGGLSRARLTFAAAFYGTVFLPLLLAAQLGYLGFALLYARVFWPAVGLVAVVFVLTAAVPWQHTTRLRSALAGTWREGLRVATLLGYGAVLIAIGGLAHTWDRLALPLVPVSAMATAVTIGLLRRPARRGAGWRLTAACTAMTVAATVFVGTRDAGRAPVPEERNGSLMIMSGINSASGLGAVFHIPPERFGLTCEQVYYYSYAGKGDGQPRGHARCPIRTGAPYEPEDTGRPMIEQAEVFADQVADLPEPIRVIGHSHSVWVAWLAVASGMAPEVDELVLIGPFSESTQGYLPAGQRGPGHVASELLRLLAPLTEPVDFNFDPDAPAVRQMLADPRGVEEIFEQSLPEDVGAISLTSTTDLPLMPSGWRLPVDRNACPIREAHPYLPTSEALYREVNRYLDGEPPPPCPSWRDWGAPASAPFGPPPARE